MEAAIAIILIAKISERHVAVVGFWRQAVRVRRPWNLHSAVELFEPERRQVGELPPLAGRYGVPSLHRLSWRMREYYRIS